MRASACVEVGGRRVGRSVSDGSSRIEIRLSRMRSHHEGLHQKWHHATYDLETRTEGLGVGPANPGTLPVCHMAARGWGSAPRHTCQEEIVTTYHSVCRVRSNASRTIQQQRGQSEMHEAGNQPHTQLHANEHFRRWCIWGSLMMDSGMWWKCVIMLTSTKRHPGFCSFGSV